MRVGIVGLGLIGGSIARAAKRCKSYEIFALDACYDVIEEALSDNVIDGELTSDNLSDCDVTFVALYPDATVDYVREHVDVIHNVIIDCCGVKATVCEPCFELARQGGFTFIGGHPMAGREISGFAASQADLFDGRSMILVPDEGANVPDAVLQLINNLGFSNINISTAAEHDRVIAYTSQLAHVLSNAYMRCNTDSRMHGFSADSFRDLTRVAKMNTEMWCELFMKNADALVPVIEQLVGALTGYADAIRKQDISTLAALIDEGVRKKEALL